MLLPDKEDCKSFDTVVNKIIKTEKLFLKLKMRPNKFAFRKDQTLGKLPRSTNKFATPISEFITQQYILSFDIKPKKK